MTSRPRTAKKTAEAPAKKTTAKRTTAAATRPARKRAPRKNTAGAPKLSLVKTRDELPVRDKPFMSDAQGLATLAARMVGILTPRITAWTDHPDGTTTRPLQDGTLHYTQATRTLTWQATCRMGAVHTYLLDSPATAAAARVQAATCTQPHADLSTVQPLTRDELEALGLHTGPTWARPDLLGDDISATIRIPLPTQRERALGDELTRSGAGVDETQPIPTLNPDTEMPKEHPQP